MNDRNTTFTLDQATAERIDRLARRLAVPKSRVVREAVREYATLWTLNVADFADLPGLRVEGPA